MSRKRRFFSDVTDELGSKQVSPCSNQLDASLFKGKLRQVVCDIIKRCLQSFCLVCYILNKIEAVLQCYVFIP